MIEVLDILNDFEAITLNELENLRLLDRQDTKFAFNISRLPEILNELNIDYFALELEESRVFHYDNIYLDTQDMFLYKQHHNGKKNRFKARLRHYEELDKYFFEVKFKSNTGTTFKRRLEQQDFSYKIGKEVKEVIEDWVHFNPKALMPKARIKYQRITLANLSVPEKITIDFGLQFSGNGVVKDLPNIAIAELKQPKASNHSQFATLMKKNLIYPMKVSKYVLATLSCFENIKYNRFKPTIIKLNKIILENDEHIRYSTLRSSVVL